MRKALLANLHSSHTEFLTSNEQEFWPLESVFSGQVDGTPPTLIGAWAFITFKIKTNYENYQRSMLRETTLCDRSQLRCVLKIDSFNLWSRTNNESRLELAAAASKASGERSDIVILDLGDKFVGADPEFLNPFFDYDENGKPILQVFNKPATAITAAEFEMEWISSVLI